MPRLYDEALRARIASNLAGFPRLAHPHEGLRPAAVALVLLPDPEGVPCFVITRRAPRLRAHTGQWALPGGRVDAGETAEQAALRELSEEVGLELASDAVVGCLDDYPTRSGYCMTPVVVWGGAHARLEPESGRGGGRLHVPLQELLRPDVPQLRRFPRARAR
jgi:8-oxo-dGTP pyrophosphatase MutT (NUDIX family)